MVSLLSPLRLAAVHSALEIPLGAVRAGYARLFAFLADPRHWMGSEPREMVHKSQSKAQESQPWGWQRGYCWGEWSRAGAG